MREHLFRGKRKDNGEWIDGSAIWFDEDICFIMPPHPNASTLTYTEIFALTAKMVIPETVGQYTGLNDKNGKKIFEGDIVKIGNHIRFVFYGTNSFKYTNYGKYAADLTMKIADNCEVIGNIHDNPELLKEVEE